MRTDKLSRTVLHIYLCTLQSMLQVLIQPPDLNSLIVNSRPIRPDEMPESELGEERTRKCRYDSVSQTR